MVRQNGVLESTSDVRPCLREEALARAQGVSGVQCKWRRENSPSSGICTDFRDTRGALLETTSVAGAMSLLLTNARPISSYAPCFELAPYATASARTRASTYLDKFYQKL